MGWLEFPWFHNVMHLRYKHRMILGLCFFWIYPNLCRSNVSFVRRKTRCHWPPVRFNNCEWAKICKHVLDPWTTNCQLPTSTVMCSEAEQLWMSVENTTKDHTKFTNYINCQLTTSTAGWNQDVTFFTKALNISFSLSDAKGQRPKGVAWLQPWRVISTCRFG